MKVTGAFNFTGPSKNKIARIADLAELECLRRAGLSVSPSDVLIAMEGGNFDEDGAEAVPPRDRDADEVVEAFADVDARGAHCGNGYPFRHDRGAADRIAVNRIEDGQQWLALLYLFLLWLTRTSANDGHVQYARNRLFERLCCDVARSYWGGDATASKVKVFHLGKHGGLKPKADELAKQLSDRGKLSEEASESGRNLRDDGVDIVVFRPFADKRAGQVIGFGQCKSGHGYGRKDLTECQPAAFIGNWFHSRTVVESSFVRLFFLSDRIADKELMFRYGNMAGVLFDRCRIMEHATDVAPDLKDEITAWILARLEEFEVLDRLEAVGIGRLSKSE